MDRKPRIAVACNMDKPAERVISGVIAAYMDALIEAGGAPFIVPMTQDRALLEEYLDISDGLFIPGGIDVCPLVYGEEPIRALGRANVELDRFQLKLLGIARSRKLPVLGVCRGIQVMNVEAGGTLIQDVSTGLGHRQKNLDGSHAYHSLTAERGSRIARIFGTRFGVNSFHHQAVKDLASGYRVTARAADGLIEAMESTDGSYAVGVQWHPERMIHKEPDNLELFRDFVLECAKRADKDA